MAPTPATVEPVRSAPTILRRIRRVFLTFAVINLALMVPLLLSTDHPGPRKAVALGAVLALGATWVMGHRASRFPWPVEPIEALAVFAVAAGTGEPGRALGVYYVGLHFRSLFGSTTSALVRAGLWVATLFLATADASGLSSAASPQMAFHVLGFGVTAVVMRMVAELLQRQARSEAEIQSADARYRALVEQIPAAAYIDAYDRDGSGVPTPIYMSPHVEAMLGYPLEAWMHQPDLWDRLVHPDDHERVMAEAARAVGDGSPLEIDYRLVAQDGRVVWVHEAATPLIDEATDRVLWHGIMQDVTVRKEAEEVSGRLAAIVSSSDDAIISRALDGTVLAWNAGAERLFGYAAEEAIGRSMIDLGIGMGPQWLEEVGAALGLGRAIVDQRTTRTRRDGSVVHVSMTVSPVRDEGGAVVGDSIIARDISDQIASEKRLRDTIARLHASDAARRSLLERVLTAQEEERRRIAEDVHDDPLQMLVAVGMRMELLKRSLQDPSQIAAVDQLLQTVGVGIDRFRRMIFELRPRTLDTAGLGSALREYLERMDGITFELDDRLASEPPTEVAAIAYRIAQEALVNVRKHARATTVTVSLENIDGGIRVAVRDDGVGMSPGALEASVPGHLGLSSIRERADMIGGWAAMSSRPGEGTLVEFWLPCGDPDQRHGADIEPLALTAGGVADSRVILD